MTTALVTGGGRGIGRAIALGLAEEGLDVVVSARSTDQIQAVAGEAERTGVRSLALACDVSDRDAVFAVVSKAEETLGPIDVLVNNAGINFSGKFMAADDAVWQRVMDVNLHGAVHCIQAALPGMLQRGWGRIINIASIGGLMPIRYASPYVASKHALVGLTRTLALETAHKGITVNAICPGWVETDMAEDSLQAIMDSTGLNRESALQAIVSMNAQRRLLDPDEVAHVARLLVREEARGITGQALIVDGGSLST